MNEPRASRSTEIPGVHPGIDERTYREPSSTLLAVTKAIKSQWEPSLGIAIEQSLDALESDLEADLEAEKIARSILDEIKPYLALEDHRQVKSMLHELSEHASQRAASCKVGTADK